MVGGRACRCKREKRTSLRAPFEYRSIERLIKRFIRQQMVPPGAKCLVLLDISVVFGATNTFIFFQLLQL